MRRRLRGRRQLLTRRRHGFRGGIDLAHRCTQIVRELGEIPRHRTDLILSAEIAASPYIRGIIRAQIEAGKILHHALKIAHRCRNPLRDKGDQHRQKQENTDDADGDKDIDHVVRHSSEHIIVRRGADAPLRRNAVKGNRCIHIKCFVAGTGGVLANREGMLCRAFKDILALNARQLIEILHHHAVIPALGDNAALLPEENIVLIV